jgi:hypothetical protein
MSAQPAEGEKHGLLSEGGIQPLYIETPTSPTAVAGNTTAQRARRAKPRTPWTAWTQFQVLSFVMLVVCAGLGAVGITGFANVQECANYKQPCGWQCFQNRDGHANAYCSTTNAKWPLRNPVCYYSDEPAGATPYPVPSPGISAEQTCALCVTGYQRASEDDVCHPAFGPAPVFGFTLLFSVIAFVGFGAAFSALCCCCCSAMLSLCLRPASPSRRFEGDSVVVVPPPAALLRPTVKGAINGSSSADEQRVYDKCMLVIPGLPDWLESGLAMCVDSAMDGNIVRKQLVATSEETGKQLFAISLGSAAQENLRQRASAANASI